MIRLSVVVACTRPDRIAALADALATSEPPVPCELVVAGDVAGLDPQGWPVPTVLIPCADRHPNRRRQEALAVAGGAVVGFLDDDALPMPGWASAAASIDPGAWEIWTGPEQPPRDTPGSRLARAVAATPLAEGTRAHVAGGGSLAWFEVPFCNLVAPRAVLDDLGPLPTRHAWDLDDFVVCQEAARRGVRFAGRADLAITHDRYPDRPVDWLAGKAAERRRTGEKLVRYPEVYGRLPGAVVAAAAPWLALAGLALAGRHRRGVVGAAAVAYLAALGVEAWRTGARGAGALRFAGGVAALHAVSVGAMQAGVAGATVARAAGRPDPWVAASPAPMAEEVPWPAPC